MITFTTELTSSGGNATGIAVPEQLWHELTTARKAAVVVTLNGYEYRSSIGWYRGAFMLPVSSEHRTAAGLTAGDLVEVTVELDTAPRVVEVPHDLAAEFSGNPIAAAAWARLAYSHQKEHVRSLEEAKTPETRTRRLQKALEKLTGA